MSLISLSELNLIYFSVLYFIKVNFVFIYLLYTVYYLFSILQNSKSQKVLYFQPLFFMCLKCISLAFRASKCVWFGSYVCVGFTVSDQTKLAGALQICAPSDAVFLSSGYMSVVWFHCLHHHISSCFTNVLLSWFLV